MLNIEPIFKNKIPNPTRLLAFGFTLSENKYTISYGLLNNQFQMNIAITCSNEVTIQVKVIDNESNEEYVLIHTSHVEGGYIGTLKQACEEKLEIIADFCFDTSIFQCEQAKHIISYVEAAHQNQLEFLWKKFSDNAVYRRHDNQKWYAVMLKVPKNKLGFDQNEAVEIIDLRGLPDEIEQLIDGKHYFPGYHMNKKHWYTICLDGSVSLDEICERIEKSYALAKK